MFPNITLNSICHSSDHLISWSKSLCNRSESRLVLILVLDCYWRLCGCQSRFQRCDYFLLLLGFLVVMRTIFTSTCAESFNVPGFIIIANIWRTPVSSQSWIIFVLSVVGMPRPYDGHRSRLFTVAVYTYAAFVRRSTATSRFWTLDSLPSVRFASKYYCVFTSLPRPPWWAPAPPGTKASAGRQRRVSR